MGFDKDNNFIPFAAKKDVWLKQMVKKIEYKTNTIMLKQIMFKTNINIIKKSPAV